MKLKVFTRDGKENGTVDVSDDLFGQEVNAGLLHEVITLYLANKRQGTSKVKKRDEVSGGGKKPWRQKGTGRARAGSNTSPVWVRGGKAHGPKPRDYTVMIPKKVRKTALRHALSSRAQAERVMVVENLVCESPKTRELAALIRNLALADRKTLLLTDGVQKNTYLSGRNIRNLEVLPIADINAYEVLKNDTVVLSGRDLVAKLEQVVVS